MALSAWITLLFTHPVEFRVLLQYYLYHEQKRDITAMKEHETSGWDRKTMRKCWDFLDKTSRSFSAVIKELDGDLARTVCLFYLVLRGLDTIEDDMTIPDHKKQPMLRQFHKLTVTPGWTFHECGPNEKDRQLLVEYDQVVAELLLLRSDYRDIILDVTEKMETGMADFAHKAATTGSIYLDTVADYELYCHYVAGLVGEGLSRLFSASQKEVPWLGDQHELSNSLGLLLQKTNIIRDYREDCEENRFFWPREIWGQKQFGFKEMREMYAPEAQERAQWVQSAMVLDAMRHLTDALDYLRLLKNQSVFAFCAIPASMAIATLELCFMNPDMFQRNIKIRKAEAASLIMRSINPREVATIFRTYCRKIHARALPEDPNFLRISVACGKVEQWCEHNYPSFVQVPSTAGSPPTYNPEDARSRIIVLDQETDQALQKKRRVLDIRRKVGGDGTGARQAAGATGSEWEIFMYIAAMICDTCKTQKRGSQCSKTDIKTFASTARCSPCFTFRNKKCSSEDEAKRYRIKKALNFTDALYDSMVSGLERREQSERTASFLVPVESLRTTSERRQRRDRTRNGSSEARSSGNKPSPVNVPVASVSAPSNPSPSRPANEDQAGPGMALPDGSSLTTSRGPSNPASTSHSITSRNKTKAKANSTTPGAPTSTPTAKTPITSTSPVITTTRKSRTRTVTTIRTRAAAQVDPGPPLTSESKDSEPDPSPKKMKLDHKTAVSVSPRASGTGATTSHPATSSGSPSSSISRSIAPPSESSPGRSSFLSPPSLAESSPTMVPVSVSTLNSERKSQEDSGMQPPGHTSASIPSDLPVTNAQGQIISATTTTTHITTSPASASTTTSASAKISTVTTRHRDSNPIITANSSLLELECGPSQTEIETPHPHRPANTPSGSTSYGDAPKSESPGRKRKRTDLVSVSLSSPSSPTGVGTGAGLCVDAGEGIRIDADTSASRDPDSARVPVPTLSSVIIATDQFIHASPTSPQAPTIPESVATLPALAPGTGRTSSSADQLMEVEMGRHDLESLPSSSSPPTGAGVCADHPDADEGPGVQVDASPSLDSACVPQVPISSAIACDELIAIDASRTSPQAPTILESAPTLPAADSDSTPFSDQLMEVEMEQNTERNTAMTSMEVDSILPPTPDPVRLQEVRAVEIQTHYDQEQFDSILAAISALKEDLAKKEARNNVLNKRIEEWETKVGKQSRVINGLRFDSLMKDVRVQDLEKKVKNEESICVELEDRNRELVEDVKYYRRREYRRKRLIAEMRTVALEAYEGLYRVQKHLELKGGNHGRLVPDGLEQGEIFETGDGKALVDVCIQTDEAKNRRDSVVEHVEIKSEQPELEAMTPAEVPVTSPEDIYAPSLIAEREKAEFSFISMMRTEISQLRNQIMMNRTGSPEGETGTSPEQLYQILGKWDQDLLEIAKRRLELVEIFTDEIGGEESSTVGHHDESVERMPTRTMSGGISYDEEEEEEEAAVMGVLTVDERTPMASSVAASHGETLGMDSSISEVRKNSAEKNEVPVDEMDDDEYLVLAYPDDDLDLPDNDGDRDLTQDSGGVSAEDTPISESVLG
ncbi:hypothetical protein D9758_009016 [Tetrapyrgos nigripes]|uniref:squalene synthase n=1 Tax=Tetrapyrgos nigripes TaxID=182062 RepID=A0A8H5LL24_9AGAR|nr:hypothetical protein D9758_009016 [Tetrapyrgos nigripes]